MKARSLHRADRLHFSLIALLLRFVDVLIMVPVGYTTVTPCGVIHRLVSFLSTPINHLDLPYPIV